jgi:predicted component of type VI protein secretion system
MKVSLVVASGVHQGKVIPVPGAQFLIGRDPECQLRPASQAVSKQHCAILIRGESVFVKDFGSTNGTFVNGDQLPPDAEREIQAGDRLKLGPLDFTVQFAPGKPSDTTPLPDVLQSVAGKTGSSATQKPVPAPTAPQKIPPATSQPDEEYDAAAAMLLGMGDEEPGTDPKVPGGSTIMDMTSVNAEAEAAAGEKKDEKKGATPSREDTSNAASEILRRYMRRPR